MPRKLPLWLLIVCLICLFPAAASAAESAEAASPLPFEGAASVSIDIGREENYILPLSARVTLRPAQTARAFADMLARATPTDDPEGYDRAVNPGGNALTPLVKRERPDRKNNRIVVSAKGRSHTLEVIRCGDGHAVFVYNKTYYEMPADAVEALLLLRDVKGPLPQTHSKDSLALLEKHGLSTLGAVAERTYTLPKTMKDLPAHAEADDMYFAMANLFSGAVGLDLSAHAGERVTAAAYPLFTGGRSPYDTAPPPFAVVYRTSSGVVGAHIGLPFFRREEGILAQSLSGQSFSQISGVPEEEWVSALFATEDPAEIENARRTPEEVLRAFTDAMRKGNAKDFAALRSRQMALEAAFPQQKAEPPYDLPRLSQQSLRIPYQSVRLYRIASSAPQFPDLPDNRTRRYADITLSLKQGFLGILPTGEIMAVTFVKEYEGGPWRVDVLE